MERKNFLAATQNQNGFSLIEILIAITLVGITATYVGGKIYDSLKEGEIKSAKIQMDNLDGRLKEFRRKCSSYPTTDQGLEALITKPTNGRECRDYPPGGFIEDKTQVPQDPWGKDYVYESDGKTFTLYSYGTDGAPGGSGNDADIYHNAPTPRGGAAQNNNASQDTPPPASGQGNNEANSQ